MAWINKYISQKAVGCDYISMPKIHAFALQWHHMIWWMSWHPKSNQCLVDSPHKGLVAQKVHRNGNVVILTKFSSLAAPKVVKMTTFGAASDENFVKMMTLPFLSLSMSWRHGMFVKKQLYEAWNGNHTPQSPMGMWLLIDASYIAVFWHSAIVLTITTGLKTLSICLGQRFFLLTFYTMGSFLHLFKYSI